MFLAIVVVVNIMTGIFIPFVDNYAHGGNMLYKLVTILVYREGLLRLPLLLEQDISLIRAIRLFNVMMRFMFEFYS